VEPDGGGTSRSGPELGWGQVLDDGEHIFSDLEQRVGGGLQQRPDAGNRSAEPDLRYCHLSRVVFHPNLTELGQF
jgi:hypothetical protein